MTTISFDFEVTEGFDSFYSFAQGTAGTLTYDLNLDATFDTDFDGSGIPDFARGINSVELSLAQSDGELFEEFIDLTSFRSFESDAEVSIDPDALFFDVGLPIGASSLTNYNVIFASEEDVFSEEVIRDADTLGDLFDADFLSIFVGLDSSVFIGTSRDGFGPLQGVVTNVTLDGAVIDPIDVSQVPLGGSVGYLAVALGAVAVFKKFARRAA